jgi:hypothetical protein
VSHLGALGFKFKPIEEMPDDFIVSLVEQGRLSSFSLAINLSRHDILIFVINLELNFRFNLNLSFRKTKSETTFPLYF